MCISIHALREEGDTDRQIHKVISKISIHALREEGDQPVPSPMQPTSDFYPRPPRGGRRGAVHEGQVGHDISIHALREEGDW